MYILPFQSAFGCFKGDFVFSCICFFGAIWLFLKVDLAFFAYDYVATRTPVSPLRTRLVRIGPSYWTIFRSFEIIVEWELSIRLELNPMLYAHYCFIKTFNLIWIIFEEILNWREQLGLWRMSSSTARAKVFERTPATNDVFLSSSPAKWTRNARHGTKTYEQWQDLMKRARANNLNR